MSMPRATQLKETNPPAFGLFSKFVMEIEEVQFLNQLFRDAGYEIVSLALLFATLFW